MKTKPRATIYCKLQCKVHFGRPRRCKFPHDVREGSLRRACRPTMCERGGSEGSGLPAAYERGGSGGTAVSQCARGVAPAGWVTHVVREGWLRRDRREPMCERGGSGGVGGLVGRLGWLARGGFGGVY